MHAKTWIIDGYNLLLSLARREGATVDESNLPALRNRLLAVLAEWSEARDASLIVVWDGRGHAPDGLGDRVRCVFVEPPAEADDWIAIECEQRAARGEILAVITRDRGLIRRLPRDVERVDFDQITRELHDIATDPASAPHLRQGLDDSHPIPASTEPIDMSRLPRRRVVDESPQAPVATKTSRPARAAKPASKPTDAKLAAAERKKARRERWQRAQKRKVKK